MKGRRIKSFLLGLILSVVLLIPLPLSAAEVLQVLSSTVLKIGDQNRIYTVRLACLEVKKSDEEKARTWLKAKLRRGRKVNLRPINSMDGTLLARVNLVDADIDISEELIKSGLANSL